MCTGGEGLSGRLPRPRADRTPAAMPVSVAGVRATPLRSVSGAVVPELRAALSLAVAPGCACVSVRQRLSLVRLPQPLDPGPATMQVRPTTGQRGVLHSNRRARDSAGDPAGAWTARGPYRLPGPLRHRRLAPHPARPVAPGTGRRAVCRRAAGVDPRCVDGLPRPPEGGRAARTLSPELVRYKDRSYAAISQGLSRYLGLPATHGPVQ